jgi:hypothetical protein
MSHERIPTIDELLEGVPAMRALAIAVEAVAMATKSVAAALAIRAATNPAEENTLESEDFEGCEEKEETSNEEAESMEEDEELGESHGHGQSDGEDTRCVSCLLNDEPCDPV